MADSTGYSWSFPSSMRVYNYETNPLYIDTDMSEKPGKWMADCARMIYANNNFTESQSSDENLAKQAIAHAKVLWSQFPTDWKKAVAGTKNYQKVYW